MRTELHDTVAIVPHSALSSQGLMMSAGSPLLIDLRLLEIPIGFIAFISQMLGYSWHGAGQISGGLHLRAR